MRRFSRTIKIGPHLIGGDNPIVVQSMCSTDTRNVEATIAQIKELEAAGCQIARVAVIDSEAAAAIKKIKAGISIPLVADIHFDYKLALQSLAAGADALRINPGNIGDRKRVQNVVSACQEKNTPIRIGVNSGSLDKQMLQRYGSVCAEAMVESAVPIPEELQTALAQALSKKKGKQVKLKTRVNPDLLGGLVVTMGDQMIDMSLKGRLKEIQENLK